MQGKKRTFLSGRVLRSIGIGIIVSHTLILAIAAWAMWEYRDTGRADWRWMAWDDGIAFWILRSNIEYVAIAAFAGLLAIASYWRMHSNRPFKRFLFAYIGIRLFIWFIRASALAYLLFQGSVVARQSAVSRTIYRFSVSDLMPELAAEIFFLWIPLYVLLIPFLIPGFRRRFKRSRERTCANCGYDLRGTVTDRCSECGTSMTRGKSPLDL